METSDIQLAAAVDEHLAAIGKIGFNSDENGWTRLAYSEEENQVHEYAANQYLALGASLKRDAYGNLFGSLPAAANAKRVMLGTHLDTVPKGGNFDGVVGFIVALEAVKLLKSSGRPVVPVELVVFRGEESARFDKACLGSRAAFGFLSVQELESIHTKGKDKPIVYLEDALRSCGFANPKTNQQTLNKDNYLGYFETHIEQSRVLERLESLGIVTSIRAPERRAFRVEGTKAAKATAAMILVVEWVCFLRSAMGEDIVGTVGAIDGFFDGPDKVNAVAGFTRMKIENLERYRYRIIEPIAKACGLELGYDDAAYGNLLHLKGTTDHSGGTPMGKAFRRDALVGASHITLALDDSALPPVPPITFKLDLRSNNKDTRARCLAHIITEFERVAHSFGVKLTIEDPTEVTDPVDALDSSMQMRLRQAANKLGTPVIDLPSGAGHDALFACKAKIPSAMLFVKSINGLSHNPKEFTPTEDIVRAIRVQAEALDASNW